MIRYYRYDPLLPIWSVTTDIYNRVVKIYLAAFVFFILYILLISCYLAVEKKIVMIYCMALPLRVSFKEFLYVKATDIFSTAFHWICTSTFVELHETSDTICLAWCLLYAAKLIICLVYYLQHELTLNQLNYFN